MKANDLRIGNLVMNDGELCEIIIINTEYCVSASIAKRKRIPVATDANFEFIPLTKEWMGKIEGMEQTTHRFHCKRFRYVYHPDYNLWRILDKNSLVYITKVEYLHELQNFWYVMYEEELKLKNEMK